MATTAKRQKIIEKANAMMKGVEQSLNPETYRRDLILALNYYNASHDDKDKKKWFIKYMAAQDKKLAASMLKVDEFHFRYAGILARLIDGGSELEEKELNYLKERIEVLKELSSKKEESAKPKVTVANVNALSIQERIEETARKHAAEIDAAIDDFVLSKGKTEFSAKNYLLANQVAGTISKKIGDSYKNLSNELKEAIEGNDEQLVEGYSNFTKRELKKFSEFVDQIIVDCQQVVQTSKINRAPRRSKPVNPVKLASKVKYLKEFAELGIKSVKPDSIVNSSECWVYNTKTRRISVYRGSLTVKGTSIIGFDVSNSQQMTLRKPEEFFKGLAMGKRALTNALKVIKTKASTPNGRMNEDTIILGAF